jgi:phosphatidate cytidylyltransferase
VAGEREKEGPGSPEDLFDDLDRFFEPIGEMRYPEPPGSRGSAEPEGSGPRGGADPEPAAPGDPAVPDPGVSGAPASNDPPGEDEPPRATEPEDPDDSEIPIPEVEVEPVDAPPPADAPEPTGELTTEEWRKLREALGEDEDDAEFEFPAESVLAAPEPNDDPIFGADPEDVAPRDEPPARERRRVFDPPVPDRPATEPLVTGSDATEDLEEPGDLTSAWPEPEVEDAEEPVAPGLTLEDLKKAPPEYRDLPPPAGPPASGEADLAASFEPGPPAPTVPGEAHIRTFGGPLDEPSLADVEAMAENLAQEFREGEDEEPFVTTAAGDEGGPGGEREMFDDDLLGTVGSSVPPVEPAPPASGEAPAPPPPSPERRGPRRVKVGQPEDLIGPAWEEPTSRTVTREPGPPDRLGRDLPAAVLTGAILVAAALLSIAVKPVAFAAVAIVVVAIAQAELYTVLQRHGYQPATALGLVLGALMMAGGYLRGEPGVLMILALSVFFTFLWFMASGPRGLTNAMANIAATLLGLVYVPFLASYALVILGGTQNRALILLILGLTFLYDIAAYVTGRLWAGDLIHRPLAPTISPKKSWEGLIGATGVTLLVGAIVNIGPIDSAAKGVGLWLVVVLFAPLGDLAESLLKRDLGVKDMGTILPGHGGMLDRIDSILFVAPAALYFLRLIS